MKDLTDVDAFTSPVTVPEGTDSRDHAAEHVEAIAQALANRTRNTKGLHDALRAAFDALAADAARKSVANTFSQPNTFQNVNANDITAHDVHATHNINADNWVGSLDITATRDIDCGRNYTYLPMPSRTMIVPLALCHGDVLRSSSNGAISSGGGGYVAWCLRLPQAAVLQSVDVIGSQNSTSPSTLRLIKRSGYNWSSGSFPTEAPYIDTKTTPAVAGVYRVTLDGKSTIVDNAVNEFQIVFVRGAAQDDVQGIRVTFTDPGPRNH